MGLLKFLVTLIIGFFILPFLNTKKEELNKIPIIGGILHNNIDRNKETILIFAMALINLFI